MLHKAGLIGVVSLLCAVAWGGTKMDDNKNGEIPLGEWKGKGAFVYETWPKDGDKKPKSLFRRYPTELKIEKAKLGGEDVIQIEILSKRGKIDKDMGDSSHLIVALRKVKTVDGAAMYKMVHWLFNPKDKDKDKDKLNPDASSPPVKATCMTIDGDVILQMHYDDQFSDTLRFSGDDVYKSGTFVNLKEGLIHWTEKLKRK